jgi:hypothetical protein
VEPWRAGGDWPSSRGTDRPQTMADQLGELAGRVVIFIDGAPTPPVTSFAASNSSCMSINAHDKTLAGDASFNTRIFLAAVVVDRALKGTMARERMNKSFGREVRVKEMGCGI